MSDQSPSPTPFENEIRETLDMVGTVVASVSDRVDAQTSAMDRLVKTATEARQAAFAAQSQTDPEHYGDVIAVQMFEHLSRPIKLIHDVSQNLTNGAEHAIRVIDKGNELIEKERLTLYREVREREEKADRLKNNLPWFAMGAVVLALALTVMLPRFLASKASTCAVLGASWTTTTTGVDACVFYQR